jgi:hypothetical protein
MEKLASRGHLLVASACEAWSTAGRALHPADVPHVRKGRTERADMVAAMLAQGASTQEVLECYPSLNQEQVELAPLYVAAFPRRGRPARRPWAKLKRSYVARYKLAKKA